MIKIGDWVTHNITDERFEIIECNNKYVWLRKENGYREITTHETLYKWLYLEQIQRADELENQWNILRDRLVEIYKNDTETGKQYLRSFLCLLDELEGKENIFETVQNLED